jgi:hypothetical protein
MALTRPFAYNTGTTISGTDQVGFFAIGITNQDYSLNPGGVKWWMGPDEELGYVIATPISGNTQPTQIPDTTASVGFYRTKTLTDNSFIGLSEYVSNNVGNPQTFSSTTDASTWLTSNGYWNSFTSVESFFLLFEDGSIATTETSNNIEFDYI